MARLFRGGQLASIGAAQVKDRSTLGKEYESKYARNLGARLDYTGRSGRSGGNGELKLALAVAGAFGRTGSQRAPRGGPEPGPRAGTVHNARTRTQTRSQSGHRHGELVRHTPGNRQGPTQPYRT